MSDYISREAAIEAMYKDAEAHQEHTFWTTQHEALLNIPAADVRPVVMGKWEEKEKDGVLWYACSVCGEHIPKGRWGQEWHSNFCPNCGADMRNADD